jgi:MFS family permease
MLHFNISRTVAILPVSLYTLGFTIGPLVAAPLSELYGRRIIYWSNLPMLVIFNAIAAASDNIVVLIIFRFLAGLGGSGVLAVGAGISSYLLC